VSLCVEIRIFSRSGRSVGKRRLSQAESFFLDVAVDGEAAALEIRLAGEEKEDVGAKGMSRTQARSFTVVQDDKYRRFCGWSRRAGVLYAEGVELVEDLAVGGGHEVDAGDGDGEDEGGDDELGRDLVARMDPDQGQGERSEAQQRHDDGGGGEVPTLAAGRSAGPAGTVEKLSAIATLDRFVLDSFGTERTFFRARSIFRPGRALPFCGLFDATVFDCGCLHTISIGRSAEPL